MSGTLKRLMILVCFLSTPLQAKAFDFDSEIQKQNKISVEVAPNLGQKQVNHAQANKKSKDLRVILISKNR